MSYLLHLVLALAALGMAESGVGLGFEAPLGVLALGAAPYALRAASRRLVLKGRFRAGEALQMALAWSPPVSFLVALLVFGWNTTVEQWTGAQPGILSWPSPAALLSLAPFAVYGVLSIDAHTRLTGVSDHHGARRFHLRMFATGLVPIVGWILCAWAVGSSPVLRVHVEEVALFGTLFAALIFVAAVGVLPWVVRHGWETRPLPAGSRRALLESLAQRAGFRCRAILLWGTAHQMINAAVVGIGPRHRIVLLSDALLTQLTDRELAAVFAHELAHAVRRHALVFLVMATGLFLSADLIATWADPQGELLAGALVLAVFALWYLAFGFLSRRFELDADLWSAEVTGDPQAMVSALERVGGSRARRASTWRHFSVGDRVAFLRRAVEDPGVGVRLRRFVRRVALASIALTAVGLAGEAWLLARDYHLERVRADLRLGAYERAGERLATKDTPPDTPASELARRVHRALELPRPVSGAALVAAARAARERGDEEAARDYLELAYLRGEDLESLEAIRTGSR